MRKREKIIHIRLTEPEHKIISNNAERLKMQVAPYVRTAALSPVIQQYDYSIIAEHTKEVAAVRESINRMIFTIEVSNNYLPREIDYIVSMMERIFESENKLLETLRKERTRQYDRDRKRSK